MWEYILDKKKPIASAFRKYYLLVCKPSYMPASRPKVRLELTKLSQQFGNIYLKVSMTRYSILPLDCIIKFCGNIFWTKKKAKGQCLQKILLACLHTLLNNG